MFAVSPEVECTCRMFDCTQSSVYTVREECRCSVSIHYHERNVLCRSCALCNVSEVYAQPLPQVHSMHELDLECGCCVLDSITSVHDIVTFEP